MPRCLSRHISPPNFIFRNPNGFQRERETAGGTAPPPETPPSSPIAPAQLIMCRSIVFFVLCSFSVSTFHVQGSSELIQGVCM
ncbi:hypothetical protein HanRHA438_Chr00c17g0850881 [Helianthus annuus]|uniref:Uncharacterized protein n=1 Tax=Helianthus annuus TaxID=4232 RepID=A0A251TEG9_HELAN|nr:hypothetical protein HanXRQr2_Chr11g0514511 [Helianthus annuus]KAJ0519211.1 hypothetical protein HanHA89_Chr11g0446241 [Helianthus annuus]KAJ0687203.1 hypothetical protein HanLR1_Chr11g0423461 [Helianthus annuus]KAJ0868994.1 hypothetical protein HanRHA438_Chr11g0484271 [Helianthus annuus]KAJ0877066.1 hypothetical protein HanPSC8_Chr11g0495831 [Helianthus annuus]